MAKETVEMKATRLLLERKVAITFAQNGQVVAKVQGSEKLPYRVTFLHAAGEWTCTCVSTVLCSHIQAVMLVAQLSPEDTGPPTNDYIWDAPGF